MKRVTTPATIGEKLFLLVLNIITIFYIAFIYQTVWNWFIAEHLITLTYLQMLFGSMIMRFILIPKKPYHKLKTEEVEMSNMSFSTRFENRAFHIAMTTVVFTLFFIANVVITYYG